MITGLGHVGIHSPDPARLAAFYRDVLGMQITRQTGPDTPIAGEAVLLSSRPEEEHHELAIFASPGSEHLAFKVASLAELRAFLRRIQELGLPIIAAINSGVSLAFFFDDPEGNHVEVYWPTGITEHLPISEQIDLAVPEEALLQEVARVTEAAELSDQSDRSSDDHE